MRYHIDTISLWDAIKIEGECALCALRRKTELADIERFLGASVMEPDSRIQVNKKGFCQKHQQMLFAEKNRLGLALLMDSHIKELEIKVNSLLDKAAQSAKEGAGSSALRRMVAGKNAQANKEVLDKAQGLETLTASCILCDSLNNNMDRYVYTFFHLWQKESTFKEAVKNSKGFCLPDASRLLAVGAEKLTGETLFDFVTVMQQLLEKNLKRLEEELEWFTLKFDYRNKEKSWGNSKDALERTINKLRGWCVGEEPNPKA